MGTIKLIIKFVLLITITLSINYLFASEKMVYYRDDFEDGNAEQWKIDDRWQILTDRKENHFISASGPTWASFIDSKITPCNSLRLKIQMLKGQVQIHYCISKLGNYIIRFNNNGIFLLKKSTLKQHSLLASSVQALPYTTWNLVEIQREKSIVKIIVNGKMALSYLDRSPLVWGLTAIEVTKNSIAYFDDLAFATLSTQHVFRNIWFSTGGPSGGLGYDIRIHPSNYNIMFVTDNPSGVNKSYDRGKTWYQKNDSITTRWGPSSDGIPVFCLTIDPNYPDVVWAGTQYHKDIYRSTDCGETWEMRCNGIAEDDSISFRGFAVNPQNSDIVFAAGQVQSTKIKGRQFFVSKGVIYRTSDSGLHWRKVYVPNDSSLFRVLLFNPRHPDTMYCSSGIFDAEAFNANPDTNHLYAGGVGIIRSIDGGNSWHMINVRIKNLHVGFLDMNPLNPQTLYAAAHNGPNSDIVPGALYKTTNGGDSWKDVTTGKQLLSGEVLSEGDRFSVIAVSPSDTNIVYAASEGGFYRSNDAGKSWSKFVKPDEGDWGTSWGPPGILGGVSIGIVVHPDSSNKVYVNNYGGGVFMSRDGGETWTNYSRGYSGSDIRDTEVDPKDSNHIYVTGISGPFYSHDGGETWPGMANQWGIKLNWDLAVFPDSTTHLLGSGDVSFRIIKSRDGGQSWYETYNFDIAKRIHHLDVDENSRDYFASIVVSPSDPNVVYAGSRKRDTVGWYHPISDSSFGVFKSFNRGEHWHYLGRNMPGTKIINVIAVHPNNSDTVFVGTYLDGFLKSTDGGRHWTMNNTGIESTTLDVRSIAIDPQNPKIIYIGMGTEGAGIFKSVDGGESWKSANNGVNLECPSYLMAIGRTPVGMDLTQPRKAYVLNYYHVSWTTILSIVIDPTDPHYVYACDLEQGVYMSDNKGESWSLMNDGLTYRAVTDLSISADGKILYAGTSGGGVFKLYISHPLRAYIIE